MTLFLHCAPRTDELADELAELLATPTSDPFTQELVVVPARGVERWLTQRLSHRLGTERGEDGVCAGVQFVSPSSLVTLLLGRDRDDVWLPDQLVWPILEAIDEHLGADWCRPLAQHLGHRDETPAGQIRQGRRYAVAQRLAMLWHSYGQQRPELLADWSNGRDTDGLGGRLDHDLLWQAQLWRHVTERIQEPPPQERHTQTVRRLSAGDASLDLPDRLSLFGHTRLARTEVDLLRALGEHRDVHLWLPQTSPALWDALQTTARGVPVPRRDDPSAEFVNHPLLASLGRDARELRRTLGEISSPCPARGSAPATGDAPVAGTLLGLLQHDLRANQAPTSQVRSARRIADDDRSIQVHSCHGPARQVEVLREVLTGLLEDKKDLQPRDILVMCPDIETYAPLVQAAFGLHDLNLAAPGEAHRAGHPAHQLRVSLADRALTSTNPLLDFAARLVTIAGGRVTASEVLDLAANAVCRRRFAFDDDDLETLAEWVEEASIRWGLDAAHRETYDLAWLMDNTWALGLDRVALGVTMAAGPGNHVTGRLPVDGVDSGQVDLVGRFLEMLNRLRRTVRQLTEVQSAADWMIALREGVLGLTDVPAEDAWQVAQLDRELSAVQSAAGERTSLRLSDVRALLQRQFAGRPTRSSFRAGTLTVCTMTPMRSVPHKVVCLLGLDDGVFPRSTIVDGDDVLARTPITGERDRRSEDRQLLLDALLAATDTLVLTYSGADEHTGADRPPAVPLGEIIDACRVTAEIDPDQLVTKHPLQAYDPRNVSAVNPFSFDASALAGARASSREPQPIPPLISAPLPPRPEPDIALDDFARFFGNPAKAFLRDRLGVGLLREADEPEDAISIELEAGLEQWKLGTRLLEDALRGMPVEEVAATERMRGLLPPGALGDAALGKVGRTVERILGLAQQVRGGEPATAIDIDIDIGEGRRLVGTVPRVHGHNQVTVTYSSLTAKTDLAAWVTALALAAGRPQEQFTVHVIGKRGSGGDGRTINPIESTLAAGWLRELVEIRDRGLQEPIPFAPKTARTYANALVKSSRRSARSAMFAARGDWEGGKFPGENADPAHVAVHGEGSKIEVLLDATLSDETGTPATTRLGYYGLRVFGPLFSHERK